MKWCTNLNDAWERCPIVCQGHLSNFKVTRLKKFILIQIGRFRTVTPVWIHQWLRNDVQSLKPIRGALLFFKVICQISSSPGTQTPTLTQIGRIWTVTPHRIHWWLWMIHKAWNNIEEVSYSFQCHPSNLKVAPDKKWAILTRIEGFQTVN